MSSPEASPRSIRPYLILLGALIMQLCLGATYSWSVFVAPIRTWWKLGQGEAQVPFTVFYIVFPAMAVPAGRLLSRWPIRRCAVVGGCLFGAGWLLASLGSLHFSFTIAGIGLVAGIGAGLAYLVPIQACILWFPRHKALVSGLAVAGFGGGAALVAALGSRLMAEAGYSPFEVFRVFGLAYLFLVPLAGSIMIRPEGSLPVSSGAYPTAQVLASPMFRMLYMAMTAGLMAGFTLNANLKELLPSEAAARGAGAVALFALGNAAGRVGWGWLFDRIPGALPVALNLILQAAILLAVAFLLPRAPGSLEWLALAAGINYGGVLVLYASSVATLWGSEHVGRIYGLLFSSNIVAAIAPVAAGYAYDRTGTFLLPFLLLAALLTLAAILVSQSLRLPPSRNPEAPSPEEPVELNAR